MLGNKHSKQFSILLTNNFRMCYKELLTCKQIVSLMVFLSFVIHHPLRINISIAVVEMIARNNTKQDSLQETTKFNWDEEEKNRIFRSFFWGYVLTQTLGGYLSEKFGSKVVMGYAILVASLLTLITPVFTQLNYYCLIAIRFLLGIALGVHYPSAPPIATNWIPNSETNKFISHLSAGSLGAGIILPISGYLIAYFGWTSVFYVTGTMGFVWSLLWFYLVYDSPNQHPRISSEEKEKLRQEICFKKSKFKAVPWLKILTSGPVWAVFVANSCSSATFFIGFNQLPSYVQQVHRFDITQNGWFSGLPFLVRYFSAIVSSTIADRLKQSKRFSTTGIHKFFTVSMFLGTTFLFMLQALWGYKVYTSFIVFITSFILLGFSSPGFHSNPVYLAPAFAGTIFGLSQVPMALFADLTTKVVVWMTKEKQDFQHWSYVFWFMMIVNAFGAIFSFVFVSGEQQSWSLDAEIPEREMQELNSSTDNKENVNV